MNQYQFRAIRNSFQRDVIYCKGTEYNNNLIDFPMMRKKPEEVVILGKPISKHYHSIDYRLTKGDNVYELHHVDYKHTSSTISFITKNGVIIYWTTSPGGAPYGAAWHHLTEVYGGYGEGRFNSSWRWRSVDDFDCEDVSFTGREIAKHWEGAPYYFQHTDYQNKMHKETGKSFIDKILVSQEEIDKVAEREYYHT